MKNLLIMAFFLGLTLQLSAGTGGNNAVIVERLRQVRWKRHLLIGRKWQMVCQKPL